MARQPHTLLQPAHDLNLIRDRLHRRFGFGVWADG
jgi:hypothetical protein